jgi:hypothetical protein
MEDHEEASLGCPVSKKGGSMEDGKERTQYREFSI